MDAPFLPAVNKAKDVKTIAWLRDLAGIRHPAISIKKRGKGTIMTIHFDIVRLLNTERSHSEFPVFRKVLSALLKHYGKAAPLKVQGEGILAQSVIKNENIAVTLLPLKAGALPCSSMVIPSKEIIDSNARYVVSTLGTGKARIVKSRNGRDSWSGAELLKGIKLTIEKSRGYQLLEIVKQK